MHKVFDFILTSYSSLIVDEFSERKRSPDQLWICCISSASVLICFSCSLSLCGEISVKANLERISNTYIFSAAFKLYCYNSCSCHVYPPGLSLGDEQGRQPIGIVLTVLGVVVLDFCADATEGPIRAYLLDVADTEEQDMALNIHAASAGIPDIQHLCCSFRILIQKQ